MNSAVAQRVRAFLRTRQPGLAASSLSSTESRLDYGGDQALESSTFTVESILFSLEEGTGSSQPISDEEEEEYLYTKLVPRILQLSIFYS